MASYCNPLRVLPGRPIRRKGRPIAQADVDYALLVARKELGMWRKERDERRVQARSLATTTVEAQLARIYAEINCGRRQSTKRHALPN